MINYPFIPFYRTPYNRYHYYKNNFFNNNFHSTVKENKTEKNISKEKETSCLNNRWFFLPWNIMIEILLWDILIICLLFFLYSEGVKDDLLFIALIMLLLS